MLSEKPWKLLTAIRVLLGIVVCVSAVWLLEAGLAHLLGLEKLGERSSLYKLTQTLGLHGSILGVIWLTLVQERWRWAKAFGFRGVGSGRALLVGVAAAAGFMPVGMLLQYGSLQLLTLLHYQSPVQEAVQSLEGAGPGMTRVLMSLHAVILAPVAEEMLFRGILYTAIRQSGFPGAALWGTSLAFAVIHNNLPIFLPLTVLALVLAVLYEKTDNLLAPIAAHGAFNALGVAQILLRGGN